MPCTNNTPSLAASFPKVSAVALTLVALHNLQRITGTINGCLSDSEATARTAQVPLEILRLCCSNSTGNTPREDQVVHFSLSWWRQRKMQELIYIYRFLTARSRASTLKQLCLSVISDATLKHFTIPTSTMSNRKGNLETYFNLFSIWFNTCYHVWWHDQLFACCFGRSPCTIHEMWILEVEIAAKPWCNDNKAAANTPNTSRGNRT